MNLLRFFICYTLLCSCNVVMMTSVVASEVVREINEDQVWLTSAPDPNVVVYAVEEIVPEGVTPSNIDNGGSFDPTSMKIKWGPFFDNTERTFSYAFEITSGLSEQLEWTGIGSFDGANVSITGDAVWSEEQNPIPQTDLIVRALSEGHVVLKATPPDGALVYAIEEMVPSGISPSDISDGGTFDSGLNKIKWGPFFDNMERTLSYSFQTPLEISGTLEWSGTGSFDGSNVPITGDETLEVPGNTDGAASFVVRTIDDNLVVLEVAPPANTTVYAIEETMPPGIVGITEMEITDGGVYDEELRKIKWGPFFDANPRTIAYTFSVASDATGTLLFEGVGSVDGVNVDIRGDAEFVVEPTSTGVHILSESLKVISENSRRFFSFSVEGAPGMSFQAFASSDFKSNDWAPTGAPIITGDDGKAVFRFEFSAIDTFSFFVVRPHP